MVLPLLLLKQLVGFWRKAGIKRIHMCVCKSRSFFKIHFRIWTDFIWFVVKKTHEDTGGSAPYAWHQYIIFR